MYQISCCQDSGLKDSDCINYLLDALNEDIIDITCLVPILRTFGNIIAKDSTDNSAHKFLHRLQHGEGSTIRDILINNSGYDLSDECAWLLGNAFKAIRMNETIMKNTKVFEKVCGYFLV